MSTIESASDAATALSAHFVGLGERNVDIVKCWVAHHV
jgi:hypothetical protein